MNDRELRRLGELLDSDGDLAALNRRLADVIREGGLADRKSAVLAHLRETAADKLALANPKYAQTRKNALTAAVVALRP